MKKGIHPEFTDCVITCSCGEQIHTRSIKSEMSIEVCSKCHPFFSGKQKFLDVAGRVEKFQRKFGDNWKKSVQESKVNVPFVHDDKDEKETGNIAVDLKKIKDQVKKSPKETENKSEEAESTNEASGA